MRMISYFTCPMSYRCDAVCSICEGTRWCLCAKSIEQLKIRQKDEVHWRLIVHIDAQKTIIVAKDRLLIMSIYIYPLIYVIGMCVLYMNITLNIQCAPSSVAQKIAFRDEDCEIWCGWMCILFPLWVFWVASIFLSVQNNQSATIKSSKAIERYRL